MGITKIFVTISMNVCDISQKEACDIQHLFDSLPQGNWFGGRGEYQEYTPLGISPPQLRYCRVFYCYSCNRRQCVRKKTL